MSKIYNKAFKVGFLFNILLFIFFNFLSYLAACEKHRESMNRDKGIIFGPAGGFPDWGFPFGWDEIYLDSIVSMYARGGAVNFLIIVFCSFVFGFLFRFAWSKILSRRIEIK